MFPPGGSVRHFQVEEKMRIAHEQKSRKLKHLDEKGAEAHKVDATRTLVRSLSTKIRIAIQVVDKISVKINILRDEELWPQLNEFIQGYVKCYFFFVNSLSSSRCTRVLPHDSCMLVLFILTLVILLYLIDKPNFSLSIFFLSFFCAY